MSRSSAARTEREQARQAQQQARARKVRIARLGVAYALVLTVGIGGLVVAVRVGDDEDPTRRATAQVLLTNAPPWAAQAPGLAERIAPLGFPPVGDESYHAHALLSVYRNGQQVAVPANLGFDQAGRHSSLHTHTPDGVIHMEADDPYPYTLAHVMTTWGVRFEPGQLGGDIAAGANKVHVYINGKPAAPDAPLKDGDNVVVAYGAPGSFPTQPPAGALDAA